MSTLDASERFAAVIPLALAVSVADCEAILAAVRRQETVMPFMDPTRYRQEAEALRMTHKLVDSFLGFRQLLAETPAGQVADIAQVPPAPTICGTMSASGPNREMLACAYAPGHKEAHSWATLPTFVDGRTIAERELQSALDEARALLAKTRRKAGMRTIAAIGQEQDRLAQMTDDQS